MPAAIALALLVAGLAVVVVAQFFLDVAADGSEFWHWSQHGLLFLGGIGAGIGVAGLYQRAGSRA